VTRSIWRTTFRVAALSPTDFEDARTNRLYQILRLTGVKPIAKTQPYTNRRRIETSPTRFYDRKHISMFVIEGEKCLQQASALQRGRHLLRFAPARGNDSSSFPRFLGFAPPPRSQARWRSLRRRHLAFSLLAATSARVRVESWGMMGNACGCTWRRVGSAAAWTALAGIETKQNGADFYQVRELPMGRLVAQRWLARSLLLRVCCWDGTNLFNKHHDIMHARSHSRKDCSEEEPGGLLVEPAAYEIRI
jgi:hypothetical protein